ncbi:MAG: shikimate dehydrogenase [Deltaproteobacteria bacterium RBG_13_52_11b]|nr:MAG: shikimate dehydrogenase [Deltaproteobacteria bacterium RBG_13_52_11b]
MIDAQTKLYGIIGNPVRHTLSPLIHNRAFKRMGLNAAYLAFEVDHLEAALKGIRGLGLQGVSVTLPYKTDVIPYLDKIDTMSTKIKAINTITNEGGRLIGYNTDWSGAMAALEEKVDLKGTRVYLLGAGGAGRAIGFGLKGRGCKVTLFNRSAERAAQLANELGFDHRPLSSLATLDRLDADVLINATSAGMHPRDDVSPVPKSILQKGVTVMDIVYHPLQTVLLREAEEQGCQTINGLEMLAHQGAAQLEIWTGKRADVRQIKEDLRKAIE